MTILRFQGVRQAFISGKIGENQAKSKPYQRIQLPQKNRVFLISFNQLAEQIGT